MINASDPGTFPAINELCEIARLSKKPLVVWVGAGASAWAGLPMWGDLADRCIKEFGRKEPNFPSRQIAELVAQRDYPKIFAVCKNLSATRFASFLFEQMKMPSSVGPIYHRFLDGLRGVQPVRVVTTNVDELLEHGLNIQTVSRNDLEQVSRLINEGASFVAKLHGTIGDSSSVIFTTDEYEKLAHDEIYQRSVARIFECSTVVFVGYSLADDYVLKLLDNTAKLKKVFGDGPHFVCTTREIEALPTSVRRIRFEAVPHRDHRSAIQIIEEVGRNRRPEILFEKHHEAPADLISAHMLADCTPPGTWQSSQRIEAVRADGNKLLCYHGHGFAQSELAYSHSTALHDLAVGLLCFDKVYVPLSLLDRMHVLLGAARFEQLVREDVFRFARFHHSDVVAFDSADPKGGGAIKGISFPSVGADGSEFSNREMILRSIRPEPGKESEAEPVLAAIEAKIISVREAVPIGDLVLSILLRPSVKRLLGMSEATRAGVIPKWMIFPVLRLAGIVRLGSACNELGLASVKFGMGNDQLAGPVFSAAFGKAYAEQIASYVVAGDLSTDLGAFIENHPEALERILRFRETKVGERLREEVMLKLTASAGADVLSAINAGLREAIPLNILETSRRGFSQLCMVEDRQKYPAVWMDVNNAPSSLALWRQRAKTEFLTLCREQKLSAYDACPCGSGEKMKFCCQDALNRADPDGVTQ